MLLVSSLQSRPAVLKFPIAGVKGLDEEDDADAIKMKEGKYDGIYHQKMGFSTEVGSHKFV